MLIFTEKYRVKAVLWIRNDFFPDPDPTFQLVSDPDPDPVWDPT